MKRLVELLVAAGTMAAIALGPGLRDGGLLTRPATPALAESAPSPKFDPPKEYYLALGDSLAFGYQDVKFKTEVITSTYDPATFDTGYVDDFAAMLKGIRPDLQVVNFGCPGESSSSFVNGPCAFQLQFDLHNSFPTSESQLDAAVAFLQANPGKVSPITLDLGAIDLVNVFNACNADMSCALSQLPTVLAQFQENLDHALTALQAASPSSEIIVISPYDPYAFIPWTLDALQALSEVTSEVADAHRVAFADGTSLVSAANVCSLTLMCPGGTPSLTGDIHASDAGYATMADAIWAVSGYDRLAD